jgi:hypothetical protein
VSRIATAECQTRWRVSVDECQCLEELLLSVRRGADCLLMSVSV